MGWFTKKPFVWKVIPVTKNITLCRIRLTKSINIWEFLDVENNDIERIKNCKTTFVDNVQTYRKNVFRPNSNSFSDANNKFIGYTKDAIYSVNINNILAIEKPWNTIELLNEKEMRDALGTYESISSW